MKTHNEIIIAEAHYLLDHNATVRKASQYFGRSKSTIHHDMRVRLPYINKALATEVSKVLNTNLVERSIRGGLATKAKYEKMRRMQNEFKRNFIPAQGI